MASLIKNHSPVNLSSLFFSYIRNAFCIILDSIFLETCCICENPLVNQEKFLCAKCLLELPYIGDFSENNPAQRLFIEKVDNIVAYSLLLFRKKNITQKIIHQIKYQKATELAKYMGKIMAYFLLHNKVNIDADLIIPVPLHKYRIKERGYNQSYLIASGISEILSIPLDETIVTRTKYTKTQTKLSLNERIKNLENAFSVNPNKILLLNAIKSILLVDDVITTGTTLLTLIKCLKDAGFSGKCIIYSLAIAVDWTL